MFVRMLGQVAPGPGEGAAAEGRSYRWCRFQCQVSWGWEGGQRDDVVAEGNFTALPQVPFGVFLGRGAE